MFRSRANEKDKGGDGGMNREVSVPLVKTPDGKEFDPKAVQAQESKRRKRRIMKIAVYFMFGVISIGVFAIWLFHKDTVESLRFGSNFILTVKLRSLEIKNNEGDGVLYGDMGRKLLATPYDHCWDDKYESYEANCLYWRKMARLRVEKNDNSSSVCYTLMWEGLQPSFSVEDCFYLQHYHWYGYLNNMTSPWPISGVSLRNEEYYVEYPKEQTENLAPIWFGEQGVAVFVDSSFPFTVSWNETDKRQFCIMSTLEQRDENVPADLLQYTVCQSSSLKDVYTASQNHRQQVDTDFGFKRTHKSFLLPKPIHALSAKENLPELLLQLQRNESQCSLIELYDDWEEEFGDLSVDPIMVDKVDNLIKTAAAHQCYPILPISTFFSYKSKHFEEGINRTFFVQDHLNLVTKMVQWRGQEGAVLDVSNPHAAEWFLGHIRRLIVQLEVRALKLFHLNVPPDSTYHDSNMTYLDYTRIFYRDLASLNISLVLELATGFIPVPVYTPVRMSFYGEPGSSCLNTSIPYSLVLGMSGYSLLIADADRMALQSTTEEMFIRWLQLAIFFPVLEIPSIPLLKEKKMQKFLREVLTLRDVQLLPYLTQVWEEQPELPIIRPLWWLAPQDPQAAVINDQFLIGDRLLVAPVLCEGSGQRQVYLPQGLWKRHGMKPVRGPQTVEVLTKSFNVIPYFWYQEDGEN
ncbi:myogenesis-regulating glycosidase isoform X2 [Aplysia californica]|uniref:Myogenesis-regulating glycosidase isoform X2 n=1 Tax=Aplysia californica TaxID=6500 RepID=A0ABM0ZYY1_APLCA|nr:myogenesis-regulating glycosidase isoform X2 [Aplysia californica]